MVTGYHDDFDAGGTALGDRIGYGGPGWIDHRHQAHEAEPLDREIGIVGVELEADRELVGRQYEITEAEHSFTEPAQFQVRVVERLFHFLIENLQDRRMWKNAKIQR